MKLTTQLLSVMKRGQGEAIIKFGCSVDDIVKLAEFCEDVSVTFWVEGAKEESIVGHVASTSVNSSSSSSKSKFVIKSPESENIKTSQLSSLCNKEIELNIEMDID